MEQHTPMVLLEQDGPAVAVAPDSQGRVMTSTVDRTPGAGVGGMNRPVIEKGLRSEEERAGTLEAHIYICGGEERFWLGPEGGQFGLYFEPGSRFEFSDWRTPAVIDTEPFELVQQSKTSATFKRDCELTNYSGTRFTMGIERTVRILDAATVATVIDFDVSDAIRLVAYETDNRITNQGIHAWTAETGLPSIWILGMYNPSPMTTVVIPFRAGDESELGPKVNDTYFGKVPADYLTVEDDVLYFKGDGTRLSLINI